MSLDDQKDLSRRAILLWASDNTDTAEDIVAQSYINHQEPYAKGGVGDLSLETWKDLVSGYHNAFSNSQVRILTAMAKAASRSEAKPLATSRPVARPETAAARTFQREKSINCARIGKTLAVRTSADLFSL